MVGGGKRLSKYVCVSARNAKRNYFIKTSIASKDDSKRNRGNEMLAKTGAMHTLILNVT